MFTSDKYICDGVRMKENRLERLLWSVAFPGFGQLLNGKFFKGLLFIGLELLINAKSHLNEVIISSFHGNFNDAIVKTDYQWLMFYPCVYMFAMWDAYKDAGEKTPYAAVPFVFAAYFGTVGIIYSRGVLGPVCFGLVGMFVGIAVGLLVKAILRKMSATQK